MDRRKPLDLLLRHPCRDAGAPVAALGDPSRIAEPFHKNCPGGGNAGQIPPRPSRLVGEAEAGQRRHDDVNADASAIVYLVVYPSSANAPSVNGQNRKTILSY